MLCDLDRNELFHVVSAMSGQKHSLSFALSHPELVCEFQYTDKAIRFAKTRLRSPNDIDMGMVLHPFMDIEDAPWISLNASTRTRLVNAAIPSHKRAYVLDATHCMTQSMKDHATEFEATFLSLQRQCEGVVLASTGNMGASVSAGMKRIGKSALIFAPESITEQKRCRITRHGGNVVLVQGTYDDAVRAAISFATENPQLMYSGESIIRLAGNATTSKMIVDKLGRYPDYVFVPMGDGAHYYGIRKGFEDLRRTEYKGGRAQSPVMVGVQAQGCNPIHEAFADDRTKVVGVVPRTKADAIAIGEPRYGEPILRALRHGKDRILSVPEEDITDAQVSLYARTGIEVENSSAVAWQAFLKSIEDASIGSDRYVVVLLTGRGAVGCAVRSTGTCSAQSPVVEGARDAPSIDAEGWVR